MFLILELTDAVTIGLFPFAGNIELHATIRIVISVFVKLTLLYFPVSLLD